MDCIFEINSLSWIKITNCLILGRLHFQIMYFLNEMWKISQME